MKTGERSVSVEIMGSSMTALDAGAGEAVVLGSSFLWDAEMWRPQIDALSPHYRVVVPHLWGHGGSGPLPAATKDLRDLARQNLALLDHLGIQRFAMVGLSVGGMWGAELALLAPEQVTALALIDTYLGAEPAESRARYFAVLDAVAATRSLPDAVLDAVRRVAVAANHVLADARADAGVLHDDACALVGVDRIALDPHARRAAAALYEDADAVRAAGRRVQDARAGDARAEDRRRDAADVDAGEERLAPVARRHAVRRRVDGEAVDRGGTAQDDRRRN